MLRLRIHLQSNSASSSALIEPPGMRLKLQEEDVEGDLGDLWSSRLSLFCPLARVAGVIREGESPRLRRGLGESLS